jgi:hypothetical protein
MGVVKFRVELIGPAGKPVLDLIVSANVRAARRMKYFEDIRMSGFGRTAIGTATHHMIRHS